MPADQIVINLTGAAFGFRRSSSSRLGGRPVKLQLKGLTLTHQSPSLPLNAAIEHYCTFYQLLQPVPDFRDQLIPHVFSRHCRASAGVVAAGQPSPGPFCGGDWYPE